MHNLIFPQFADRALGDITKIDWHEVKRSLQGREVDLFTYSSPCQDISQAGKQMGLQQGSGTRSSLIWNVADAIQVLRPKYLLQENVAALVSQKFMPDFQRWLDKLSSLGYISKWQRLNSRNYGVPQNRDRVFCISMRRDVAFDYQFPHPIPLTTHLEDILEQEVDDRYFLKDDAVGRFLKANDSDNALFLQFDLPPTHEAAMFLKTYLQIETQRLGLWDKGIKACYEHLQMLSATKMYGQDSTTDTSNTPYYSYNMIKLQYISWIRDQSGHVISRPVRQIANTITTFAGRNGFIDPRDGLPNTRPHIIYTFQ